MCWCLGCCQLVPWPWATVRISARLSVAAQAAAVATVAVDAVPVAAVNIEQSEVEKSVSGPVVQKDAELTRRFQTYLEAHQREVMRYRIIPVGSATLYSDLADVTDNAARSTPRSA